MSNFVYSPTTISELEATLSSDRFETYVSLAKGDKRRALKLYKKNILLSYRFYTIIHILEVCLRNKIDQCLSKRYGLNWFENPGLLLAPAQRNILSIISKNEKRGQLIASLPFGFWSSLFGRTYEELWRHNTRFIFNSGLAVKRGYIAMHLKNIRTLRNRIAHHECILKLDVYGLEAASIDLLTLLSPIASEWLKTELLTSTISLP